MNKTFMWIKLSATERSGKMRSKMTPGGTDHDANHLTALPARYPPSARWGFRASHFPGRGLFSFRVLAQGLQSLCVSRTKTCINLVHKSQRTNQKPVGSSVARAPPSSGLECTFYSKSALPRSWWGSTAELGTGDQELGCLCSDLSATF